MIQYRKVIWKKKLIMGGVVGWRREIEQSRKTVETGGDGGIE